MSATDLQADLAAFVVGDEDWSDDGDIPPPEDAIGATRLLGKVRGFERTIESVSALAAARIADIVEWKDRRTRMARDQIARIEPSLEEWMRRRHDSSGGKIKTEHLTDGELMMRVRNRTLVVVDEDAALLFARFGNENRHWIRAKFEIAKSQAQEDVTLGKVVTGVRPTDDDADVVFVAGTQPAENGYEWRQALVNGAVVPGLLIHEPVDKKFSYKTNKQQEATP